MPIGQCITIRYLLHGANALQPAIIRHFLGICSSHVERPSRWQKHDVRSPPSTSSRTMWRGCSVIGIMPHTALDILRTTVAGSVFAGAKASNRSEKFIADREVHGLFVK